MHVHIVFVTAMLLAGAADSEVRSTSTSDSPTITLEDEVKSAMPLESGVKSMSRMSNRNKSSMVFENEKSEELFARRNKSIMSFQDGDKSTNLKTHRNKSMSFEDRIKSFMSLDNGSLTMPLVHGDKSMVHSMDKINISAPMTDRVNLTKPLVHDKSVMPSADQIKPSVLMADGTNMSKSLEHDDKSALPSGHGIKTVIHDVNGTNLTKPLIHGDKSLMLSTDQEKTLIPMADGANLTMPLVHSGANSEMDSGDGVKTKTDIAGGPNLTMHLVYGVRSGMPYMNRVKTLTTMADGINLTIQNTNTECKSEKISCLCMSESKEYVLSLEVKMYLLRDNVTGIIRCKGLKKPEEICADHHCYFATHDVSHLQNNGTGGKLMDSLISPFYPVEFKVPREGLFEHPRYARQSEPCHVQPLKNAEIKCWKWPNWINCDITCIHGYGLRMDKGVVTKTNINCRMSENRWKPRGFQDCQAYINCKAHLVMPGDLVCKEPLHAPAYCQISCLEYDQYDAVDTNTYECKNETFSRILPHCARLDDDVDLIGKPS